MHNQEHGIDQAANRIQDKVSDFGSKVGDVADAAERKGAKIVEGIENAASTVRDRLDDTVSYFRDNDARTNGGRPDELRQIASGAGADWRHCDRVLRRPHDSPSLR